MRTRLALLLCTAMLLVAPGLRAEDDDDSAGDDDDSAETEPDDAATYGFLCGVGGEDALPAAPMLLLAGAGLISRRKGQRA